ncbi:hypothetical protein CLAIMM_13770 [Cladophialophora immunda]|nr:hypothetical protein CLAIMM_13770 [Cladophialophora immunda]
MCKAALGKVLLVWGNGCNSPRRCISTAPKVNEVSRVAQFATSAVLVEAPEALELEEEPEELLLALEKAKELASQMKNIASVDVVTGSHYLQEDNPHLIGRETRSFIERVWKEREPKPAL